MSEVEYLLETGLENDTITSDNKRTKKFLFFVLHFLIYVSNFVSICSIILTGGQVEKTLFSVSQPIFTFSLTLSTLGEEVVYESWRKSGKFCMSFYSFLSMSFLVVFGYLIYSYISVEGGYWIYYIYSLFQALYYSFNWLYLRKYFYKLPEPTTSSVDMNSEDEI